MNNKFKKYLTRKNVMIIVVILIIIYLLISFSKIFGFGSSKEEELTKSNFSKYEIYNDNVILLSQLGDKFLFKDLDNKVLYETEKHVDDFIFLNDNTLLISFTTDENVNGLINYSVNTLDLKEKKITEIYNQIGSVSLYNNNGNPVIINNELKQVFEFGNTNTSSNFDVKFDKIFKNNNALFGIYHFLENNIIKTKIYQYKNSNFEYVSTFNGEITYISSDFENPNKIYITYDSSITKATSVICEKYLVNLSNTDSGETLHSNLHGRLIAGKNTNYIFDTDKMKLYSVNKDFSEVTLISDIYSLFPLSFVKVDHVTGIIHYFNRNQQLF